MGGTGFSRKIYGYIYGSYDWVFYIFIIFQLGVIMDKRNYKEMLADHISVLNTTEKEVSRLQILVAKYQDKEREIKRLVQDNPNDMTLGGKVRHYINNTEKKKPTEEEIIEWKREAFDFRNDGWFQQHYKDKLNNLKK